MAVTPNDIGISLGRSLTEIETKQAEQWITDARMLIEARLGDIAELNQTAVDYVVREAVTARLRNPEGYQSETIDDYTYRYGSGSQRVSILPEWWDLLAPAATAYTVRMTSPADLPYTGLGDTL